MTYGPPSKTTTGRRRLLDRLSHTPTPAGPTPKDIARAPAGACRSPSSIEINRNRAGSAIAFNPAGTSAAVEISSGSRTSGTPHAASRTGSAPDRVAPPVCINVLTSVDASCTEWLYHLSLFGKVSSGSDWSDPVDPAHREFAVRCTEPGRERRPRSSCWPCGRSRRCCKRGLVTAQSDRYEQVFVSFATLWP